MPDATKTITDKLSTPLSELRGVGPERGEQLARLKLATVGDLLLQRPRRYEDRRNFVAISELEVGVAAYTSGTVVDLGSKRFRGGRRSVFELILEDGSGRLHCRWWNLPFMKNYFKKGDNLAVYGKLRSAKPRTIDHPETETIETEAGDDSLHLHRIVPIYPLTEGLNQRWMRNLAWRVVEDYIQHVEEAYPHLDLPDLPTRREAIHALHFPEEMDQPEKARKRLALEEFLDLQAELHERRKRLQSGTKGLPCSGDNRFIKPFLAQLGYPLTRAQKRVLREIRADMGGSQPMRRLLQGDVGSGKTVVAANSALMAIESGFNVLLMAPTEILAEQHYRSFSKWFGELGIPVFMRTGSRKTDEEDSQTLGLSLDTVASTKPTNPDSPTITIGTHALIQGSFQVEKLGLVIIDEQHKFGVDERETLLQKGRYPHLLVMTATPIPRTLGLTLYGDLDISVIDELPPGRGTIKTYVRTPEKLPKVWDFIRNKLAAGRQAYVVYPRVEEDDEKRLKAVSREFKQLSKDLEPFQVGLLHGRVHPQEKERIMRGFRACEVHVLLATTVIEVGVDVPNATIMLIENAEQFGLAQLHQLRGRIGRGSEESFCILVAESKTEESKARLKIMAETTDGFRLAEEDLKLRGPGEFLGKVQSGLPPFRFGNLATDMDLIRRARELVTGNLEMK